MRRIFILITLLYLGSSAREKAEKSIKIIASGETHAMLEACDCPENPGGGLPKRAHIIDSLRKKSDVLLLDAGGFAGGGIYDFYTEGKSRDSLRTRAAIHAMVQMGYDAVAVGDEELQYNLQWFLSETSKAGLPLVSANCRDKSGKYLAEPYRILKKGSVTFGVTAVATTEKLFPYASSVIVEDPVASLKKIWKKLKKRSRYQLILSHLGEEATGELARQFPDCRILVNGHRKMSTKPVIENKNQYIMQFGFQGKFLSTITYNQQKDTFSPQTQQWIEINESTPGDPRILKTIMKIENAAVAKSSVFDLYIMSQCPYGLPALKDMLAFSENFSAIDLQVWFIGDVLPDSTLKSLHGTLEIDDEKIWLAVKNCFPEMWSDFLFLCASEEIGTKKAITDLNLDTTVLYRWVRENGDTELAWHYIRSQRLNVDASPTLYVNNYLYQSEVSYLRMAKEFCVDVTGKRKPKVCDSLPECFEHADCRKKGKIGACEPIEEGKGGRCTYTDAVAFDFTIVVPDAPFIQSEQRAVATTQELFPGAVVKIYKQSSPEGKKLLRKLKPTALPVYMFDSRVKHAGHYPEVASGLVEKGDWLIFKDGVMKKHYFHNRKLLKGAVDLFIDPFFPDIKAVIATLLKAYPSLKGITVNPIVFESPSSSEETIPEDKMKQEEALRWLVLAKHYGLDTFSSYLTEYRIEPGSSPWFSVLKKIGVDIDSFVSRVEKSTPLLAEVEKKIVELDIREPVELFVNNRENVVIKNQKYLDEIIKKIKK